MQKSVFFCIYLTREIVYKVEKDTHRSFERWVGSFTSEALAHTLSYQPPYHGMIVSISTQPFDEIDCIMRLNNEDLDIATLS